MKPLVPEDIDAGYHVAAEGRAWHRAIAASALGALRHSDPARILKDAWPRDERAALILRGAVNPTTTADFPVANITDAFRSLAPGSAALALFERGLKLDLTGLNSIRVPGIAAWPSQAVFVAEGAAGPSIQWRFGGAVVGPTKKILILAAATGELEAANPLTTSAVVGRVLADATNKSIDMVAFGTAPADDVQPPGLLNGVVPIPAAGPGLDEMAAMAEDLGALIGAVGEASIDPTDAVFVCSPREAMIIKSKVGPRFDNPILTTLGLPAKAVACFAPAAIASGYQGGPQIETSHQAVYHAEAATPEEIVDAGGALAVPTISTFQSDVISIKVRGRAAWAVTPGGAQVIQNVNW